MIYAVLEEAPVARAHRRSTAGRTGTRRTFKPRRAAKPLRRGLDGDPERNLHARDLDARHRIGLLARIRSELHHDDLFTALHDRVQIRTAAARRAPHAGDRVHLRLRFERRAVTLVAADRVTDLLAGLVGGSEVDVGELALG